MIAAQGPFLLSVKHWWMLVVERVVLLKEGEEGKENKWKKQGRSSFGQDGGCAWKINTQLVSHVVSFSAVYLKFG